MQQLNIAFYSDSYLPAVDGVVTSMLEFKRELERRGHKVYIFASAKMGDKKKYAARDVFLHTGVKFKPYPQYSMALFPYYSSMPMLLRKLGIDIVHAQTPFMMGFTGLLAAKFGRYPLVGHFHTMVNSRSLDAYYPKNRMLKRFYSQYLWKYTKFFYRSCDVTIAPSKAVAGVLAKHQINNVSIVPNSVDLKRFNPRTSGEAMRRRLGIRDREKVVLYLGRASREKRIDVLLKAAKLLLKKRDDVSFVVGGTGPELEANKRLANRLGIGHRVRFLGFVAPEDLTKLYAASDLLCLPSHHFETQGIVAIEAMAMGKPVVGSDDLALRDLIKNGKNGEKFRPLDHADCARKIEKVLNSSDAYKRQAISTAESYSTERVTDELLKTYEHLVSERAVN
ncbi:MAG: glycosyltransferase [Candidatus Micrarchaeota archaeon]|nr:glycosyltransferase [Candidatus Micrarchaeota archaeon]